MAKKYGNKIKFSSGVKPMLTLKVGDVAELELLKEIKQFLKGVMLSDYK